jgi:hypothetical protein
VFVVFAEEDELRELDASQALSVGHLFCVDITALATAQLPPGGYAVRTRQLAARQG